MNKQRVIEIIGRQLTKAWSAGDSHSWPSSYNPDLEAKDLANHIFTVREFPEEAVDRLVCRLLGEGCHTPGYVPPTISSGIADFKRLWEGDHIADVRKKVSPALIKGRRYRISGGGIDPIEFTASDDIELIQFGDCDGTGERRKEKAKLGYYFDNSVEGEVYHGWKEERRKESS